MPLYNQTLLFSESIKKDHQTSYKYNEILKLEGQSEFLSRFIDGQRPTKMRKNLWAKN